MTCYGARDQSFRELLTDPWFWIAGLLLIVFVLGGIQL